MDTNPHEEMDDDDDTGNPNPITTLTFINWWMTLLVLIAAGAIFLIYGR